MRTSFPHLLRSRILLSDLCADEMRTSSSSEEAPLLHTEQAGTVRNWAFTTPWKKPLGGT
ncbi:hypothetical protein [Candidatus Nitrotoga sp. BS]|uniref:hypothetical protein n=1 Tax=Candidatus Nitrotoga sp. BS TaxID=2890408 RepID=UPI001EF1B907|nr:hypothetical protein [Candidatus Nitrotoga sp. BS]